MRSSRALAVQVRLRLGAGSGRRGYASRSCEKQQVGFWGLQHVTDRQLAVSPECVIGPLRQPERFDRAIDSNGRLAWGSLTSPVAPGTKVMFWVRGSMRSRSSEVAAASTLSRTTGYSKAGIPARPIPCSRTNSTVTGPRLPTSIHAMRGALTEPPATCTKWRISSGVTALSDGAVGSAGERSGRAGCPPDEWGRPHIRLCRLGWAIILAFAMICLIRSRVTPNSSQSRPASPRCGPGRSGGT